jgi:hypothetical protein
MSAPTIPAPQESSMFRRVLARGIWERVSITLILAGAVMLMQPFWLDVFSYSFVVLLAGVIGYSIAGKLPDGR